MLCNSCDCLYINGVKCHEHGCPDRWMDETRECEGCGDEFQPEEAGQVYCSIDCQTL